MDNEILIAKCLGLAEGRETPESWWNWWNDHEAELEALMNRGEFLKLKPRQHGFGWVPMLVSQKGAVAILEKDNIPFQASTLYYERYLEEMESYRKEQKRVQREKQNELKNQHPMLVAHYPQFSGALSKILDPTDKIKPGATLQQIEAVEKT